MEWKKVYANPANKYNMLMKGEINVFVDNADIGFIQTLTMKARELGLVANFIPSTKAPVHGRVLFEKIMLAYGDWLICDKCKNLIREIKNARGDDKGNIRTDEDDHELTSFEYNIQPFRNNFVQWKNNFKDQ